MGKDKDAQDVTYRDLEKIEELRIGPIGEFETIIDVGKCKNLKELWVNVEITDRQRYYKLFEIKGNGAMYYPPIYKEKILKVQDELQEIFKRVKGIERFEFTNVNETCDIEKIDFLKYAKDLKKIGISYGNVSDYSFFENCGKLENIDLDQSDIETADVLLELKSANRFVLIGTPLAENEEELNRLREAFPEAKIIVD